MLKNCAISPTSSEKRTSDLWWDKALSYAPSSGIWIRRFGNSYSALLENQSALYFVPSKFMVDAQSRMNGFSHFMLNPMAT